MTTAAPDPAPRFPASALARRSTHDIDPGGLLMVLPRTGGKPGPVSLGIRFDIDRFKFIYALTPFFDGRVPAGRAIEITQRTEAAVFIDLEMTFEADFSRPTWRYGSVDPRPGQLVTSVTGVAILAGFAATSSLLDVAPISANSWTRIDDAECDIVVSAWRVLVPSLGSEPIVVASVCDPSLDKAS